jgi:hypothetical protein
MLRIVMFFGLLFCLSETNAQRYRTAAGVRLGSNFGISVQQKVFKYATIEGIFQAPLRNTDAAIITVLYEEHRKLIGKRLNFYYGAGVHKGWASNSENLNPSGISLIAGVEMSLDRLNLSMDYKPVLNTFSGDRFLESQSALTLRYIFIKQKKKKRNWKFWQKK